MRGRKGAVSSTVITPAKLSLPTAARLILFGLGLGLVGLVINTVISYRNLRTITENNGLVTHTQEVLVELESVVSLLKDAETGQRGYLLTGHKEYLKPYESAIGRVTAAIRHLERLTADNPSQQERLATLETRALAKLTELAATIQLHDNKNSAAALELVKSNQGKNEMDEIRRLTADLEEEERRLLADRTAESQRKVRQSVATLFVASAGVFLLLLGAALGLWQHLNFRQQSEAQIRAERKWLQVTLASIGDAVIATDNAGRVSFLNPTAETLTGWKESEAKGKPLDEVFRIVNEQSRRTVESPVAKALREGIVVGLANHTVLISRGRTELPIDDSAAPIFDESGQVFGVVLVFRDATRQRDAEQALQKLAAIVEYSDDAMISKTIDGVITSWNAAAERLFGYSADEAIGKPITLIIPEDYRDEHVNIMAKLKAGERIEHFDTVRQRKNGSQFPVSLGISPLRNSDGEVVGAAKVLRDVTERKRAEETLAFLARASRSLAALTDRESALQRAASIIVPFFADWCVVHGINHEGRIEQLACVHRDPQKSGTLRDLLGKHPLDWNSPSIAVRVLRSGKTELAAQFSEPLLAGLAGTAAEETAREDLNPSSVICAPLLIRDRVIGAMTFAACGSSHRYDRNDVTFAEDLAGRVAVAIDNSHLFHSVKQADRQKDEFLAMLAHELRNPLAAIQYATVLAQLPSAEPKQEMFEIIDRQVKNLSHLIDDLLDVSRVSQDKIQLKREFVDASTVVMHAAAVVRPLIEQRKHALVTDIAKEAMPLYADATRTEQIVANLLTNAAKYTPDGGQISLRAYPENGFVVIKVKDTGVGLPAEMLPRVFDLFTQVERTLDRSEGGLGIGLTIVRRLVEMHGGTVSAASEGLDRGSEFTVRLPMCDARDFRPIGGDEVLPLRRKPLRIAVVDDNHDTADSAARWLKLSGNDVRVAYDGFAALATIREFRPQVVLLDIGLPGMNGYEVAQTLRKEGFVTEILIAISGYGQAEDRKRSQEAGFNHHLVKPVDHKALESLLYSAQTDAAS